jgi:hypothetical protein
MKKQMIVLKKGKDIKKIASDTACCKGAPSSPK